MKRNGLFFYHVSSILHASVLFLSPFAFYSLRIQFFFSFHQHVHYFFFFLQTLELRRNDEAESFSLTSEKWQNSSSLDVDMREIYPDGWLLNCKIWLSCDGMKSLG